MFDGECVSSFLLCDREEKGWQLHLVKFGLGCFCCLGFGLFDSLSRQKSQKHREKSEKDQIFFSLLAEGMCFWVS